MQTTLSNKSLKLVMIFPLLFVLMPRPNLSGIQFFTYPVVAIILVYIGLVLLKDVKFHIKFIFISSFLYLYSLSIILSATFNMGEFPLTSLIEIFKPLLFLIILCFGYIVGIKRNIASIKKGLLKCAYVILIIQVIVGIPQLLDISLFDWIYEDEKARPLGGLIRIVGTMSNPNFFGWIVIQMAAIIFLFENKEKRRWLWMLIGLVLILLSGSRSSLLIFPFVILLLKFMLDRRNIFFYLVKIPLYLSILGAGFLFLYWFLKNYGVYFPYLNQILSILETGSLNSINSYNSRTLLWNSSLTKIHEHGSVITWMFGLGPGSMKVLDNDYLYALVNYGVVGLSINMMMYAVFYIYLSKIRYKDFGILGKQYILFSLVIGFQADTLNGWNYPLFIMFYMGIAMALYRKEPDKPQNLKLRELNLIY